MPPRELSELEANQRAARDLALRAWRHLEASTRTVAPRRRHSTVIFGNFFLLATVGLLYFTAVMLVVTVRLLWRVSLLVGVGLIALLWAVATLQVRLKRHFDQAK